MACNDWSTVESDATIGEYSQRKPTQGSLEISVRNHLQLRPEFCRFPEAFWFYIAGGVGKRQFIGIGWDTLL